MAFGFSKMVADRIEERFAANPDDPVARLGYICVKRNLMPSSISNILGVSKQTIYDWFAGRYEPGPDSIERVKTLLKDLNKTK